MNGVIIDWDFKKQSQVSEHSNGSEIHALYNGIIKTHFICNFLLSIGFPFNKATLTYEDNKTTISQVLKDIITPQ